MPFAGAAEAVLEAELRRAAYGPWTAALPPLLADASVAWRLAARRFLSRERVTRISARMATPMMTSTPTVTPAAAPVLSDVLAAADEREGGQCVSEAEQGEGGGV
jgi:hypothetical protein